MKNRNTQKLIAFLGLVIINLTVFAQQVPLIDHQYFKPFIANPATTGLENPGAFLLARYQWVDVEGAPRTFVGAFDGSFGEKKIGLGLLASSDRSNILERNGITASYRYGLRIKDDQKLHFGLALGLQASNLNFDQINSPTPAEITLIQNVESFKALDLGFGLNYELKDISLRFGAQQLFRNTHTFEDEIRRLTYSFNYREHGHLALLYRIKATDKVNVIPQAILRADKNLNTQFEALATLNYNESLNIGLRYRQDFGMSFYASALTHDYLWLGYSYSHSTGPVSNLSKRSHEIMIAVKTEKLANRIKDSDFDGVPDSEDQEKFSPLGAPVDSVGVALDSDNDGVVDGRDMELHSRPDCQVDKWGVVLDGDRDSVPDCIDQEPHTPIGAEVDSVGRAIDSDNDQVIDLYDMEPFTPHWKHVHNSHTVGKTVL